MRAANKIQKSIEIYSQWAVSIYHYHRRHWQLSILGVGEKEEEEGEGEEIEDGIRGKWMF